MMTPPWERDWGDSAQQPQQQQSRAPWERDWGETAQSIPDGLTDAQRRTAAYRQENEDFRAWLAQANWMPDAGINPRNLLQAFNIGDEAASLDARVQNIFRPESERLDPAYAAQLERERVETMREETPLRAAAAEFMGAAPLGAVRTGAGAVQAFTQARPLVSAAIGGGIGAGVAGAGAGETPIDRAASAGAYGTLGAIAGPATMKALGFAGGVINRGARSLGFARDDAADAVTGEAARMARRMGVEGDIQRAQSQGLGGETGDFVAERLGARSRQTAIGLSGSGDTAQEIAEDAISARQAGRAGRIDDVIAEGLGRDPSRSAADDILDLDAVRQQAKPLFNQADQSMGQVTPNVRRILRDIQRAGISLDDVNTISARYGERGIDISAYGDDIGGLPDQIQLGDLRATARAIEARARSIQTAGDDPGNLWNMARELRDAVSRQSPEYSQAAQIWRSAARDEEALEVGQAIFQAGAQADARIRRAVTGGMSQSERQMFMAGVSDALQRRLDNVATEGNTAARLDRRVIRRRLNQVLGEDATAEIMSNIRREIGQSRFEATASREIGSQTEPRIAGRERVRQGQVDPVRALAAEGIENPLGLLTGREGRRQAADLIRSGSDEALGELARMLYSQGGIGDDPLAKRIIQEAARRGVGVVATNPAGVSAVSSNALAARLD